MASVVSTLVSVSLEFDLDFTYLKKETSLCVLLINDEVADIFGVLSFNFGYSEGTLEFVFMRGKLIFQSRVVLILVAREFGVFVLVRDDICLEGVARGNIYDGGPTAQLIVTTIVFFRYCLG